MRTRIAGDVRYVVKRLIDLGISLVTLVVLSPLLVGIAVAIKLDSRGPVLFVQERMGSTRTRRRGVARWEPRVFGCAKFRSMYADADESAHRQHIKQFVDGSLDTGGEAAPNFKMVEDPRVTRVGGFLRKTSLDELPQLLNVVKGDMSLVGPRPVPVYEVAEYEPWHYERLDAKPGITGIWQVYGRGRVTFDEMVQMDIEYVRRPSITGDFKLLVLTVPAVFAGKGAH